MLRQLANNGWYDRTQSAVCFPFCNNLFRHFAVLFSCLLSLVEAVEAWIYARSSCMTKIKLWTF